jgi:hypothetical protein
MKDTAFAMADMGCDDRDYDSWVATLTEASARLDALQTAVTELRHLCERENVHTEQLLEALERHGAIIKAAHARFATA